MLIKQFCEATGLPRDTVRFYVKRGLLAPAVGSRDSNRYQVFDAAQVERAKLIKTAQRLGFSLRQIAELARSYEAQEAGSEAKTAVLRAQIIGIEAQERALRQVRTYLAAKLRWVEGGEIGPAPTFNVRPEMQAADKVGRRRDATGTGGEKPEPSRERSWDDRPDAGSVDTALS